MQQYSRSTAFIFGAFVCAGLVALGALLGEAALDYREYERTVTVKGLSEREYPADLVIWPLQFTVAGNDLESLYGAIEGDSQRIRNWLVQNGIPGAEITFTSPAIVDKSAQQYGGGERPEFRYTATPIVTVYSRAIDTVRSAMGALPELGKSGIVFSGDNYQYRTEYLFSRLNEVKPEMVEEATREARAVAEKFAADSASSLGKIRQASQGQFTISDRDLNNPHIKVVRVVSTVEYYLSD
jgi:uncharacterized protein